MADKVCNVCGGTGEISDVKHKRNGTITMKVIRCPMGCKKTKSLDLRDVLKR